MQSPALLLAASLAVAKPLARFLREMWRNTAERSASARARGSGAQPASAFSAMARMAGSSPSAMTLARVKRGSARSDSEAGEPASASTVTVADAGPVRANTCAPALGISPSEPSLARMASSARREPDSARPSDESMMNVRAITSTGAALAVAAARVVSEDSSIPTPRSVLLRTRTPSEAIHSAEGRSMSDVLVLHSVTDTVRPSTCASDWPFRTLCTATGSGPLSGSSVM